MTNDECKRCELLVNDDSDTSSSLEHARWNRLAVYNALRPAYFHRSHHAAGRSRQDRHLPRRRRATWPTPILQIPGAARLRAVLRGPAGRGHAEPDGAHLRRLPRGPSHGGHQGPGRPVPRRSAAGGQEAPRAVLQHFLRHRPHDALLRPGRAGLRRRPHRPAGPAQHPRRGRQGGHGRGQARARRCGTTATN